MNQALKDFVSLQKKPVYNPYFGFFKQSKSFIPKDEVIEMIKKGKNTKMIAIEFNCSKVYIEQIKRDYDRRQKTENKS